MTLTDSDRYDPGRNERRKVILAAYDNAAEFEKRVEDERTGLAQRQRAGEAESAELIGGMHQPPGHRARMSAQRLRPRPKKARERKR